MFTAPKVFSGTWGEVWVDGDLVAECYGVQAKVKFNKEPVPMCRQMAVDQKVTSIECTGSLKLYKVSSRMALAIGEYIRNGRDIRFTIVAKLDDPDAKGCERVALLNVSFDDLTLLDFEAKSIGKVECPFTFTNYEMLDTVAP